MALADKEALVDKEALACRMLPTCRRHAADLSDAAGTLECVVRVNKVQMYVLNCI